MMTGHLTGVEPKLQAAETALEGAQPDDRTRDLIGHIAAIRAMLAVPQNQVETLLAQSRRALEYLHPNNLPARMTATWALGYASILQGDRTAARRAYAEVIALSQAVGNIILYIGATIGLGTVQEADNQLYQAAEIYRRVLQLAGDLPQPPACEAHLGLARICYEWNDLETAERHGQHSLSLARQMENADKCIACEVVLARVKLARGDLAGAATLLAEASQSARRHNLVFRRLEVAAAQVLIWLRQGQFVAAAQLAETSDLPLSQARVYLTQGDPSTALEVLAAWREQVEAKRLEDERLKVLVLQALALQAQGEGDQAVQLLLDALALAEPEGFIRTFVDEGRPMAQLLSAAAAQGLFPDYLGKLLSACDSEQQRADPRSLPPTIPAQTLFHPLSPRELEVLHLMARGLSNQEISEQLVIAESTVKGHNLNIFGKLQVERRTEAVARARELGLL